MAAEPDDDALGRLRDQLLATREAAERIAQDVPPQGWATPQDAAEAGDEIRALIGVLHGLRDLLPEELWEQVREVTRQLLLLLRALLDLLLDRLATDVPTHSGRPGVQDIPIS